jgi:DNA recombination protein Rad52
MDIQKVVEQLESNIPREVIKQRDGGGNKKLDYLEGWYVINKMNEIFGNMNWCSETIKLDLLPAELPTYVAKVRIIVKCPDGSMVYKDGTGWGADKGSRNPHEMAVKEAETDALKRAAMKFGKSLGLALYDKTQEYVEETPQAKPATKASTVTLADKLKVKARTVVSKKTTTKENLQKYLVDNFNVEKIDMLSNEQQKSFDSYLDTMMN